MVGIIWRQWPIGKCNRGAVAPWHGKRGAVAPWHGEKNGVQWPHGMEKWGQWPHGWQVQEHGPPLAGIERGAVAPWHEERKQQKKGGAAAPGYAKMGCSGPMAGINRGMGPPWQVLKGGSGPRAYKKGGAVSPEHGRKYTLWYHLTMSHGGMQVETIHQRSWQCWAFSPSPKAAAMGHPPVEERQLA